MNKAKRATSNLDKSEREAEMNLFTQEIIDSHKLWLINDPKGIRANLSGANLSEANLSEANLSGADLSGANLPAPTGVILANWGELSDELTKLAMAYDASNHDNPELFNVWASGGSCPYGKSKFQRACSFQEKRELWDPTVKCPRGFDLMAALIREKCADSDYHDKYSQ